MQCRIHVGQLAADVPEDLLAHRGDVPADDGVDRTCSPQSRHLLRDDCRTSAPIDDHEFDFTAQNSSATAQFGDGEITAGLTRRPEDARGSLDGNHIGDAYRQLAMGHWTPLTSAIAACI
ncbi:Uncharacterised protein [Mycobacteroides abscessus subsp. abscessus]|nr:Uncharacterised protein [Mycobacteroides abscessus subsp. abscessus]